MASIGVEDVEHLSSLLSARPLPPLLHPPLFFQTGVGTVVAIFLEIACEL